MTALQQKQSARVGVRIAVYCWVQYSVLLFAQAWSSRSRRAFRVGFSSILLIRAMLSPRLRTRVIQIMTLFSRGCFMKMRGFICVFLCFCMGFACLVSGFRIAMLRRNYFAWPFLTLLWTVVRFAYLSSTERAEPLMLCVSWPTCATPSCHIGLTPFVPRAVLGGHRTVAVIC